MSTEANARPHQEDRLEEIRKRYDEECTVPCWPDDPCGECSGLQEHGHEDIAWLIAEAHSRGDSARQTTTIRA